MKSLIYYGPKDIRLENRDIPEVSGNDVLVKIAKAGICGTDLTAYRVGGITTGILAKNQFGHDGQFGHEMVGTIVGIGEHITNIKIGDRVFINPTTSKRTGMLGCGIAGAFSEYTSVENAAYGYNLLKLPDDIAFDDIILTEPLAVGTHAKNKINVKPHENIVIYGAGTIGFGALAACLSIGCVSPVVADVNFDRLEIVKQLGGVPFNLASEESFSDFLMRHFGTTKNEFGFTCVDVDAFIDAAGAPTVPNDIIHMAKKGARLSIVGIHKEDISVDFAQVLSKELTIKGACGYEFEDVLEAFNHLVNKRTKVTKIITHHFPHEQAVDAFKTAEDIKSGAVKVVIDYEEQ